ncbi:MAG: hypothetical protein JJ896_03485 [Rhodothermales bacterium]|nr:hypothetical protein [Rhodothermales bacterium]MBO6778696.1 hypothetical protein [Rhodothermales bacterium]
MNRRAFVRTAATGIAALPALPTIISKRALSGIIIGHGDYRYEVDLEWGNLDPMAHPVKNCHEMVQDAAGRLIMITDETRNNVLIYDRSGRLLDSWGTEYPYGHGLTLSGDTLWICDNGFDGNPRVVQTTLDGRVLQQLPTPQEVGAYETDQNYRPTETAVAPNGDIYVADGYGSQFVLQFSPTGDFIRKFGGSGNEDAQFSTVHGVAIDTRGGAEPTLICTSRGHNAFKRFTLDGEYLETVFLPGAYVCRPVMHGDMLFSGVCWSRLRYLNQTPNSGFVTILDRDNRVVSNPGGTAPEYRDGELQLMVQQEDLFRHCHDVCVDADKNLYVCQWNAEQTYPIRLVRV